MDHIFPMDPRTNDRRDDIFPLLALQILFVHHYTGLSKTEPESRIIMVIVERNYKTLERFLRPLQMKHCNAQVVQNFRSFSCSDAMQWRLRTDVVNGGLIESERMLKEPHRHRVMANMKMYQPHVVGQNCVIVFAIRPVFGDGELIE